MTVAFLSLFYGYSLSGAFSLGKLLAVSVGGLWLSFWRVRKGSPAEVAYFLACLLSFWLSEDRWISFWGIHGTLTTGLLPVLALVPFALCLQDRGQLEKGLTVSVFVITLVAVLQRWGGYFLNEGLPTGGRVYSTIGSPVYLGSYCVLAFPFCVGWGRACLILLLVLAKSRGAMVALLISATYLYSPQISRIDRRIRIFALVVLGAVSSFALYSKPASDLGRVLVWSAALEATKQKPLFGWGLGNFLVIANRYRNPAWDEVFSNTTQDHAHNLFLEAAACSGLLGLVTLLWFLVDLWRKSDRPTRAALLGVGLTGMFNPLPVIVRAICLSFSGSQIETQEAGKLWKNSCAALAVTAFFLVSLFVHWDRMMTFYGDIPWSVSSMQALVNSNLGRIKNFPPRLFR